MLVRAVMRVRRMVRCMMPVRQLMPVRPAVTVNMAAMRTNIAVSMATTMPTMSMSAVRTALCMADMAKKTKRGHRHHAGEAQIQAEPVSIHNFVMPNSGTFITHYIAPALQYNRQKKKAGDTITRFLSLNFIAGFEILRGS